MARDVFGGDELDVVADRGYFKSTEILACDQAGITVTLPKPSTSTAKAAGRFGKQGFRYVPDEDVYICPAGNRLIYRYTRCEDGLNMRRYWTDLCGGCSMKPQCMPGKEHRVGLIEPGKTTAQPKIANLEASEAVCRHRPRILSAIDDKSSDDGCELKMQNSQSLFTRSRSVGANGSGRMRWKRC